MDGEADSVRGDGDAALHSQYVPDVSTVPMLLLLPLLWLVHTSMAGRMEVLYSWSQVDFTFPSSALREVYLAGGHFIPKHNVIIDVDVWGGKSYQRIVTRFIGKGDGLFLSTVLLRGRGGEDDLIPAYTVIVSINVQIIYEDSPPHFVIIVLLRGRGGEDDLIPAYTVIVSINVQIIYEDSPPHFVIIVLLRGRGGEDDLIPAYTVIVSINVQIIYEDSPPHVVIIRVNSLMTNHTRYAQHLEDMFKPFQRFSEIRPWRASGVAEAVLLPSCYRLRFHCLPDNRYCHRTYLGVEEGKLQVWPTTRSKFDRSRDDFPTQVRVIRCSRYCLVSIVTCISPLIQPALHVPYRSSSSDERLSLVECAAYLRVPKLVTRQ
ncbi:cuticle pigmentation [Homalodisca vitripennis]|nr:cuticle pigmentation [Homalodisca vitripennis]